MYAVITGDIVASQELSAEQRRQLPRRLGETAKRCRLDATFEQFGGDSWQALCPEPARAIEQALRFRTDLWGRHRIDCRASVGIGTVEQIQPEKISLSQGEAFVLSGRGLDRLPDTRRLVAALSPSSSLPVGNLLAASCALLDGIALHWTPKQALAVSLAWNGAPQKELAKQFDPPISAQAFGKHLASAQWKLVEHALENIAQALFELPLGAAPTPSESTP